MPSMIPTSVSAFCALVSSSVTCASRQLLLQIRLQAELGVVGIGDDDRHAALELLLDLVVEGEPGRRLVDDVLRRATAHRALLELRAVLAQLVVELAAEEVG